MPEKELSDEKTLHSIIVICNLDFKSRKCRMLSDFIFYDRNKNMLNQPKQWIKNRVYVYICARGNLTLSVHTVWNVMK